MKRSTALLAVFLILLGSGVAAGLEPELESPTNWAAPPFWAPSPSAAERSREQAGLLAPETLTMTPLPFIALTPCRIVDTRGGAPLGGGFLPASTPRSYTLTGQCGIPVGAGAASLNIAVTNTGGPGYVSIWPQGTAQPVVATLNYVGAQTIANAAVVPLGAGGGITVACMNAGCDLIVDTNGFYAAETVVNTLNGLSGAVTLGQGTNVTITPSGNTLTIASPAFAGSGTAATVPHSDHTHDAAALVSGTLPDGRLSGTYTGALNLSSSANELSAASVNLSSTGAITRGGGRYLFSVSDTDVFLGHAAGNFSMTGGSNTGVGIYALTYNAAGYGNSGFGASALASNADGHDNTAVGTDALSAASDPGANYNSAFGSSALSDNVSGHRNVAVGALGIRSLQAGNFNSALGYSALASVTGGSYNTALGANALYQMTGGTYNIAVGAYAGQLASGTSTMNIYIGHDGADESNTIRIGTGGNQTRAFVAGIFNATSASGIPVLVNASGQLGTTTSSRRYKRDITDVGEESDVLLKLRPVAFRYDAARDPSGERQYGLVAEEVAEVAPDLVVYGNDGQPETVKYHLVNALLLDRVQKQEKEIEELRRVVEELRSLVAP